MAGFIKQYVVAKEIGNKVLRMFLHMDHTINSRRAGRLQREGWLIEFRSIVPCGDQKCVVEIAMRRASKWRSILNFETMKRHRFQMRQTTDYSKLLRMLAKYDSTAA